MSKNLFERDLKAAIKGEVRFDKTTRGIYATDASNYQIWPVGVVTPKDEADVLAAVNLARQYQVSILPRGGGTGLGGQTVSKSLVLDFSKYMNKILEVNVEEKWVRVQPGLVRDNLNAELAQHNLHYAPDPATTSRANIGGIIGNNSSGSRSIVYGKAVDHLLETKVALADGEVMSFGPLNPQAYQQQASNQDRQGEILRTFKDIVESNRNEIDDKYPTIMRRVSGYNLDEFTHTDQWNLAKLICGSEGTLGLLLETKLNLEPLPQAASLCVIHFAKLLDAIKATQKIVEYGPSAVEIIDRSVIQMALNNLSSASQRDFIEGDPAVVLIVEFYGKNKKDAEEKTQKLVRDMQAQQTGYAWPIRSDKAGMDRVWAIRKNGLGLMLGMKGSRKPSPFIEDAAIPLEHLPEYIDQILKFCASIDRQVVMYAHASVGVIHVRPVLDLHEQEDIDKMMRITDFSFDLVKKFGGSFSSEHGDGRVRSAYIEKFYGPKIYQALKEVKQLFDPQNLMNPGNIIDTEPMDRNLRYGTGYRINPIQTHYHYLEDGNFAAAVEMCSGVGACRQSLAGTMCPSYRATLDEVHSTRGRANALRLAMTGQLGEEGMASEGVAEVLDLCLSCKACKSECPSNVDVARLKSEFLQHYHDKHGTSLRDRLISRSRRMAQFCSGWKAPLVNAIQRTALFRFILEKLTGFDHRRRLPEYARETLPAWFARRSNGAAAKKKVVLFDDTYLNFHEPHVGQSAVELLESCGFEVILAQAGCCQRPRISHGFLKLAKAEGEPVLRKLDDYISQGLDIVCCEPSCCSALTDDLPDLIGDRSLKQRIADHVMMIDVFLDRAVHTGHIADRFKPLVDKLVLHGHCHQKALYGTAAMNALYAKTDGLEFSELETGCCGMAGSFGYEKEHYDLSLQVGEDRLLPALRKLDDNTAIVACGFSCRHQIADTTGKQALHWVQTLRGQKK